MIIDFHTHCYPDDLAASAIKLRWNDRNYHADGTVGGLLKDLRDSGTDRAVVLHVARKPATMHSVNDFAARIQRQYPDRLRCFGSVHPDSPEAMEELHRIRELGLYGVKLHPAFQMFEPTRKCYFPLYEEIGRLGLPTLFHCGCDAADIPHLQPTDLEVILPHFGHAPVIGAHLGGLWNNVTHDHLQQLDVLESLPVYVDTGFCANYFSDAEVKAVLSRLKPERVLYGSDTPWIDARMQLEQLQRLHLDPLVMERILCRNAIELLDWQ